MQFDLISDFHVEMNVAYSTTRFWTEGEPLFYAWHKDRKSDVLVIAGDVANDIHQAQLVVNEAAAHYEHVIYVDGNHEHYECYRNGMTVMRNCEQLDNWFNNRNRQVDNVTFLNSGTVTKQFGGTMFIGANGWYDFRFAKGMHTKDQEKAWRGRYDPTIGSNDPVRIRFGKKYRPQKMAEYQMKALKAHVELAQTNDDVQEIVIVTHTLPIWTAFGEYGKPSHPFYPLNGAYGNEMMCLVWDADKAGKIKTWCFGHTHERRDFFENGIHFVCNPRGYRGEKKWNNAGFGGIVQVDTEEPEVASAFGEVE